MRLNEHEDGARAAAVMDVATEPVPSNSKLLRLGWKRILVCKPNQHQFGHFAIEMFYALAYARLRQVPVVFLRSRSLRVGHTLLEIETDEVRIRRSRTARLIARVGWWWVAKLAEGLRRWERTIAFGIGQSVAAELQRYVQAQPALSKPVRAHLVRLRKRMKGQAAAVKRPSPVVRHSYNRRQLASNPVHTRLTRSAEARAGSLAAEFGISPETKLVSLHVRERGFKLGDEKQDKAGDVWDDSVRNARIETHLPAIDFLVERGYTVLRMGDPTMAPLSRPGVIDLATSPSRDQLIELHCLLRSHFIICGESGPYSLSFLTNTPLLAVNSTDPIGAFPIRPDGIYLLKTIIDRSTGRPLAGAEHVSSERLWGLRNPAKYEFVENTPDQILDAVREMLDLLAQDTPESLAQAWWRELITEAAGEFQQLPYVRKHGPDRGYMGHGRLARSLADPWFEQAGRFAAGSQERERALA